MHSLRALTVSNRLAMADEALSIPRKAYTARAEYFACREDVETMLQQGYSIRMAYERMRKENRIACSYSAFCDYVRGSGKRLHSRKKGAPKVPMPKAPLPTPKRAENPRATTQNEGKIIDPRTMSVEDGI